MWGKEVRGVRRELCKEIMEKMGEQYDKRDAFGQWSFNYENEGYNIALDDLKKIMQEMGYVETKD